MIELVWLERRITKKIFWITYWRIEKVLQYRKLDSWDKTEDGEIIKRHWSDWQDVPTVND